MSSSGDKAIEMVLKSVRLYLQHFKISELDIMSELAALSYFLPDPQTHCILHFVRNGLVIPLEEVPWVFDFASLISQFLERVSPDLYLEACVSTGGPPTRTPEYRDFRAYHNGENAKPRYFRKLNPIKPDDPNAPKHYDTLSLYFGNLRCDKIF
ncbi:MAG: hypothetical protein QXO15_08220 [Nitrososphaerota archaeon]